MGTEENTTSTNKRRRSLLRRQSSEGLYLYELLEVPKKATQDEIKKAYYKQALKYHPDKNPNNPEAEEKIREINEAYDILSDHKQRTIYDSLGSVGLRYINKFGWQTHQFVYSRWFKCLAVGVILSACLFTMCCCCCCCCNCCCQCCGFCPYEEEEEEPKGVLSIQELENMQSAEIETKNQTPSKSFSHDDVAYIDDVAPTVVTCKITKTSDIKSDINSSI